MFKFEVYRPIRDPSVTDGDRQWGLPATKPAPQFVKELDWAQHVFGEKAAYSLNPVEKRDYAAIDAGTIIDANELLHNIKVDVSSSAMAMTLSPADEVSGEVFMLLLRKYQSVEATCH